MLYCPYDYGKNGTGVFPRVLCDINKLHYPQLGTLVQHAPLWVSGYISKIGGGEITLKNARLEFEA